jgi:hypothetical protein
VLICEEFVSESLIGPIKCGKMVDVEAGLEKCTAGKSNLRSRPLKWSGETDQLLGTWTEKDRQSPHKEYIY